MLYYFRWRWSIVRSPETAFDRKRVAVADVVATVVDVVEMLEMVTALCRDSADVEGGGCHDLNRKLAPETFRMVKKSVLPRRCSTHRSVRGVVHADWIAATPVGDIVETCH